MRLYFIFTSATLFQNVTVFIFTSAPLFQIATVLYSHVCSVISECGCTLFSRLFHCFRMRLYLLVGVVLALLLEGIVCPPVNQAKEKTEEKKEADDDKEDPVSEVMKWPHSHRLKARAHRGVVAQRQVILGIKISTLFIHLWHAHCKRLDAALRIRTCANIWLYAHQERIRSDLHKSRRLRCAEGIRLENSTILCHRTSQQKEEGDSMRRSGNTTSWFRTCAHRERSDLCGDPLGVQRALD